MPRGQKTVSVRQAELKSIETKLAGYHYNKLDDMPPELRAEVHSIAKKVGSVADRIAEQEASNGASPSASVPAVESAPVEKAETAKKK